MNSTSKTHQLSVQARSPCILTAQVWVEDPPVEPVLDNTSGSPVSLALLPAGFHAVRVKFQKLSTVSPPNPTHQSPTTGSVCLMTWSGEADARMARLNNDARSRANMSRKPLKMQPFVSREYDDVFQGNCTSTRGLRFGEFSLRPRDVAEEFTWYYRRVSGEKKRRGTSEVDAHTATAMDILGRERWIDG